MANYPTSLCYIFEKPERSREILSSIIETDKEGFLEIDFGKIKEKDENFESMSKDEKRNWVYENYGDYFASEFHYEIYPDFTVIDFETRWNPLFPLFRELARKFETKVYCVFYDVTGDRCATDLMYYDSKKRNDLLIEIKVDKDEYLEKIENCINFQSIGIFENIPLAVKTWRSGDGIIEKNGSVMWKQHEERRIKQEPNLFEVKNVISDLERLIDCRFNEDKSTFEFIAVITKLISEEKEKRKIAYEIEAKERKLKWAKARGVTVEKIEEEENFDPFSEENRVK